MRRALRYQGLQPRKGLADGFAARPELLAGLAQIGRESELSDRECQGPAIRFWQGGVAGHRSAFKTLRDDLIQAEQAALTGAGQIGEIHRPGVEAGRERAIATPGAAVAPRTLLGIELGPLHEIGHPGGGQGHGVSQQ